MEVASMVIGESTTTMNVGWVRLLVHLVVERIVGHNKSVTILEAGVGNEAVFDMGWRFWGRFNQRAPRYESVV
jgi:hypothetical protein